MRAAEARTLFEYNHWANGRIFDRASQLPSEQYMQPAGLSFGSLHGTLLHILVAEQVWRQRVKDRVSPRGAPTQEDIPDFQVLRVLWERESGQWREFLATTTDNALDAAIGYRTTDGMERQTPLWQIVAHVVNHGTQFRSEAAVYLTQQGLSPGDLDFILYVRTAAHQP
jgi:uncharacterized damage-inducible protein DinB